MRSLLISVCLGMGWNVLGAQDVQFNRDVRPILSDRCFSCHGPDSKNNSTPLRLDTAAGAAVDLISGGRAVVPGDPEASVLLQRVTTDNPALRMPPSYRGHAKLSDEEIAVLTKWVEGGGEWQGHWAFIPPTRPPVELPENGWPRNAIDAFVLKRLTRQGLEPAPEAARATLIRRASLDLTGLPPTPEEVDSFLADESPQAYERVVDRLLASPRYGERMAFRWLDAARYADTNGYQNDEERSMWRWRDWVIESFNRNQPFDEFTVEQLAGDLLPNPTLDQLIATGFNRNHRGNGELGIDPTEYIVEYAVDRVEATSTVWLGLTFGCARCHDHKYDPLTQKEFYQFAAYFNNVPDRGRYFKYGNTPPVVHAPTESQQRKLDQLDEEIGRLREEVSGDAKGAAEAIRQWTADGSTWELTRRMVYRAYGEDDKAFDGEWVDDLGEEVNFDFFDPFTLAVRIRAEDPTGGLISRYRPQATERGSKGFGLFLEDAHLQLHLESADIDDRMIVRSSEPLELNRWTHVAATYDASRLATGISLYVDGAPVETEVIVDHSNNNTIATDVPLRFGIGPGVHDRFKGQAHDARIYDRTLSPQEVGVVSVAENPEQIAAISEPTTRQYDKLRMAWFEEAASHRLKLAWSRLQQASLEREQMIRDIPTVMVMAEREDQRPTHVLTRGAFDAPAERVYPNLSAALTGEPLPTRLDLARWIVGRQNPLTARVTVNRFWQMIFGAGIVKTVEDFGSQGDWPSNPELLDWLAVEFMDSGWDVRGLLKTIVMSATYRQNSATTAEKLEVDPDNRLLSRGPRGRLPAEAIRDQALAVAGLLHEELGGPSVKPYQPAGLWTELSNWSAYKQDEGEGLYRRSLYTFWKRTIAPPSMLTFDSASRETCVVRETRTNTPLQALDLMNDVAYVEAARVMAERMMHEGGTTPTDRLTYGFRVATAREPSTAESGILLRNFRRYLDRYQTSPQEALLYLSSGEKQRDELLTASEHAAYAATASLILNLDETITKE